MLKDVVLAGTVRTPIGGFSGALSGVSAVALGSETVKGVLSRTGVSPDQIDEVIFGNVISAGQGQNVARQIAMGGSLPEKVGGTSVNKVCGSGLKAVMLAAQAIMCGDSEVIIAGGTENMSQAPYLLPKARSGYRMGHGEIIDSMIHDGLWDIYNNMHMGICGDRCAEKCGFTRQDQDDFAVESYRRARAAMEGAFDDELIAVEARTGKKTATVDRDEEPQRFNEEKLRGLRPAFGKEGTVTAGNASSVNDGAAAVLVCTAEKARELGITPQAKILGYSTHSREPEWFTLSPAKAIEHLLKNLKLTPGDVDLYEINEAFSVVTMAAMKDLQLSHEKVNVHGGAVALGHPIGASGARTLVTLLNALKIHDKTIGVDALCIGGGEGVALAVQRL